MYDQDKQISTGTTILAITYDRGVMIAADSRTSSGIYVHDRTADKLDFVHDRIYCLRSGNAAHTQWLSKIVRHYISTISISSNRAPYVKSAANIFKTLIYKYKDNLGAAVIVAGWDPYEGPQIYQVPPSGAILQSGWSIGGSGSGYLYGFFDKNYKENMTELEAKNFLIDAVALAIKRDGSSGGVIRLVNITKDEVKRDFVDYNQIPKFRTD